MRLLAVVIVAGCGFSGHAVDAVPGSDAVVIDADPIAPDADPPDADPPDADPPDAPPPPCPPSYTSTVSSTNSMYRLITASGAEVTWLAAEQDCEDDGVGTHLVVIEAASENTQLDALIGAEMWIGLSDRVTEGTWRWVTGATTVPFDWGSGQPSGGATQNCGEYNGSGWHDDGCDVPQLFVCECDGVDPAPGAF